MSLTIGATTMVFNQFGSSILYMPPRLNGESTTLEFKATNASQTAQVILGFAGTGNLLPNGLTPSFPSLSAWNYQAAAAYTSFPDTVFRGAINTISICNGPDLPPAAPTINANGVVPVFSTSSVIQSGEWISIYGTNLAAASQTWKGDFPTSLGGTSVTIDGKPAYLWYVSPTQINVQAPDDSGAGPVAVVITTAVGKASTIVTLSRFAPSLSLLDGKHVAGIILRTNGSGASGGGDYDIIGPTGNSLGYPTRAAQPGDLVELFGVGFGPTTPAVPPGQAF